MAWLKVDDGFYDHPKVDTLSLQAVGLWLLMATYASKHGTGGFIGSHRVTRFGGDSVPDDTRSNPIEELLNSSLIYRVEGGYQFHDWGDYNPTSEAVKTRREDMSKGGQEGNHRRWHTMRGVIDPACEWCSSGDRESIGVPDSGGDSGGESSRPVPSPIRTPDPKPDPEPDRFDDFWSVYPRKVAKKDAEKKFKSAVKSGVDPQDIIDSAEQFAGVVANTEKKFIPHPTTWLNQGRWDDDIADLADTGTEGGPSVWDNIQPRQPKKP